jgi:redox-sensitive bicupin YhaK (pirin superfamily)
MCPQLYQDLAPSQLAEDRLSPNGSRVRVIAGSYNGLAGPVRERPTRPLLATLFLEDERPSLVDLPEGHTAFAFVAGGQVELGPENAGTLVAAGSLALLGPGNVLRMRAVGQRAEVILAAGRPLGEPIVQRGPFVMNTEAEIQKAWEDYRAGVLDKA